MELEAWLAVYQAVNVTRAAKEKVLWAIVGLFLLGSSLLAVPACLLAASLSDAPSQALVTGLGILVAIVALAWLACQSLAARETRHWDGLLRSLEQQFAGGEFHRSAYRLLRGEETCVPTADWRCGDWYPAVSRLGWIARTLPRAAAFVLPLVFLAAWVILMIATWTT